MPYSRVRRAEYILHVICISIACQHRVNDTEVAKCYFITGSAKGEPEYRSGTQYVFG
jgi:hypothetical protein